MKMESNRVVNLHAQSMAQNDFPYIAYSHPSPASSLVWQSDKYCILEPTFLHLLHSIFLHYT